MTSPEFWRSAGQHLLERNESGWLALTPDFLRAYYTRPEIHPIDDSCAVEVKLFEDLMADPFRQVEPAQLELLADDDVRDNYRFLLGFRDVLSAAGTLEAGYLKLVRPGAPRIPPLFLDQLVHVILRKVLTDVSDPIRLRAGELFFREQNVNTENDRIMLADREIVEMYSDTGAAGGLGRLLAQSGTAARSVELDVLDEENKSIYWERSDRFDTVIDFRFGQPAVDAIARVIESWIGHFLSVETRVAPKKAFDYEPGNYVLGLDRAASEIFNALVENQEFPIDMGENIVALFTLQLPDQSVLVEQARGQPIYLGLAKGNDGRLKMKPQNILVNLPITQTS